MLEPHNEENKNAWYGVLSDDLSKILAERCAEVEGNFDRKYSDLHSLLVRLMDNTYRIACHHVWMLGNPSIVKLPKNRKVIFAAVHKNFFVFYSAIELAKQGLFGPSRTLLRHIFEYLMIAKFCAVSEDSHVFEKWEKGDTVYFTNGVLKKIAKPDKEEFVDFWSMLCAFSHSTTVSQQTGVDWEAGESEILATFSLIRALLECHYHILNSLLITGSMRRFAERYDDKGELKRRRAEAREILKVTRKLLGGKARGLVRDFTTSWKLVS